MSIYKKIFIIVVCLVWLFSYSYWANTKNETKETIIPVNIEKSFPSDIYNIDAYFCNQWIDAEKITQRWYMTARPWEHTAICYLVYNQLDRDITININFNEFTKTGDCQWGVSSDNDFAKLIKNNTNGYFPLYIPAHKQAVKKFPLVIPKDAKTSINWCVSFSISWAAVKETWSMFSFVTRRTAPVFITLTWDIYQFGRRDDIKDTYSTNKSFIMKIIIAILVLWLIGTILQKDKKKQKHHTKK